MKINDLYDKDFLDSKDIDVLNCNTKMLLREILFLQYKIENCYINNKSVNQELIVYLNNKKRHKDNYSSIIDLLKIDFSDLQVLSLLKEASITINELNNDINKILAEINEEQYNAHRQAELNKRLSESNIIGVMIVVRRRLIRAIERHKKQRVKRAGRSYIAF